MTVETFDASTTWTCPDGVTSVDIECWGGGGGGASASAGGGAGGGGYSKKVAYAVTPTTGYTVSVGAGGSANNAGSDSYFDTSGTVLAKGGAPGSTTNGGLGGSSSTGIGDTKYSGGNGANASGPAGGGGGSSAGSAANGNNGSGTSGGSAPTDGGAGGNGGSGFGVNGSAGSAPGGGGGGSGAMATGGAGAAGRVRLTYEVAAGDDGVLLLADDDGFSGLMNVGGADIGDGYG